MADQSENCSFNKLSSQNSGLKFRVECLVNTVLKSEEKNQSDFFIVVPLYW